MSRTYKVKNTNAGILYLEMPEELSILEDFMIIDLNLNNVQEYIEKIEKAMSHSSTEEISGNTTALSINSDKTTVYNMAINQECTVDTKEFKELISLYVKESIQYSIEKNIQQLQKLLEKTKEAGSLADILKLKQDLQQNKVI